jgi:hypothetical protein
VIGIVIMLLGGFAPSVIYGLVYLLSGRVSDAVSLHYSCNRRSASSAGFYTRFGRYSGTAARSANVEYVNCGAGVWNPAWLHRGS